MNISDLFLEHLLSRGGEKVTLPRLLSALICLLTPSVFANECTVKLIESVPIYSSHCDIHSLSVTKGDTYLVQFKFTNKKEPQVVESLLAIEQQITEPVAAQKLPNGYRLFLGPVTKDKISRYKSKLKAIGIAEVVLKSVPMTAVKRQKTKADTTNKPTKEVLYKGVGTAGALHFFIVMSNPEHPLRVSYPESKNVCEKSIENGRLANQNEYVALLLSDAIVNELHGSLATPFWLNEHEVVTRIKQHVEKRKASKDVQYNVICTVRENLPR